MIFVKFKGGVLAKLFLFFLLVFCFFPNAVFSQENSNSGWLQLGGNAGVGLPYGEFKQEYKSPMLAGGIDFMVGVPRLNLMFGVEYKRMNMDTESNSIDDTIPTGGGIHALGMDTDAKSRMDIFHVGSWFVPWKEAKISPYVGVSGGVKTITLSSERTARYRNDDEKLDENKEVKFALSYSGRVGILYKLQKNLMLDINAQWNGSSRTSYPEDIAFDDEGKVDPDMTRSKTDMLVFTVGFVFVNWPES